MCRRCLIAKLSRCARCGANFCAACLAVSLVVAPILGPSNRHEHVEQTPFSPGPIGQIANINLLSTAGTLGTL